MMKKLIIAGAALAAMSLPSSAADLRTKAPLLAPAPIANWTGFYVGVHAGAGWGTTESSSNLGGLLGGGILPISSHNNNGFVGGGQLGYNWQTGVLVLGVEGSISWSGIEGTAPCLVAFACSTEMNWNGDVSARLGFVASERLLVYAKAGVAFGDFDYNFAGNFGGGFVIGGGVSETRVGGLIGMGAEYAFMPNWTAKIEYNYVDFGSDSYNFPLVTPFGNISVPAEITSSAHVMKFGVNYQWR